MPCSSAFVERRERSIELEEEAPGAVMPVLPRYRRNCVFARDSALPQFASDHRDPCGIGRTLVLLGSIVTIAPVNLSPSSCSAFIMRKA